MAIGHYLKEIGRGARGAKPLDRAQAADLFGQVLDGAVTDLEIGAFCLAMRIKGETPAELAGFLDATCQRLQRMPTGPATVVLPSYNGARRLPLLTPLLALLLARQGLAVLIHGTATEAGRVCVSNVLPALDVPTQAAIEFIAEGQVGFVPTALLCPGLQRLLDVRRVVGLRNPAHSVVKLLNPCVGPAVVVASYTHAAYAVSMAETFLLTDATALLSRGMEGEVVADPRRSPEFMGFSRGQRTLLQESLPGTVTDVPGMPASTDVDATVRYTQDVLAGLWPVPESIAQQVEHILRLVPAAHTGAHTGPPIDPPIEAHTTP